MGLLLFLQVFTEPEFIAMTVTFLLMLSLFHFWQVILLLKPAMLLRTEPVSLSKTIDVRLKMTSIICLNVACKWLLVIRRASKSAEDSDRLVSSSLL